MVLADALQTATWGLFGATALLVIATAIPAVQRWSELRNRERSRSARVIPTMHMLRSNMNGDLSRLDALSTPTVEEMHETDHRVERMLDLLAPVVKASPDYGLRFTNEVYVCRHLLTQSGMHSREAFLELQEAGDGRDAFNRCRRELRAAKLTLDAAEDLLKPETKTIDGERFWDRFARVSDERIAQADAARRRDSGR